MSTLKTGEGLLLLAAAVTLAAVLFTSSPQETDWSQSFRPSASNMIQGRSPYGDGFFNPPWIALLLAPFTLLPPPYDYALFVAANLAAFCLFCYRLRFHPVASLFFITSIPVVYSLRVGNIDGLVLVGAALPPQVGLFLVLAKPQVGAVMALYWLAETARSPAPVKNILTTFAPVTVTLALSVWVFGPWFLGAFRLTEAFWNVSIWPWGVPVGLALAARAIHRREKHLAVGAAPFLSSYLALQSWSAALAALGKRPALMAGLNVGLWVGAGLLFFIP